MNDNAIPVFWGIVAFIIAIILIGAIINTSQNTSALRKNVYLLFKERFSFYLSIGDTERAKEVLIDRVLADKDFRQAFGENPMNIRQKFYDKYHSYFEALGIEIDYEKVNDFYYNLKTKR